MSNEEKFTRHLHVFSQVLLVVWGIVFTLLFTTVAGDARRYVFGAPLGWSALWLITTIGSVTVGVAMLIGGGWKTLPILQRRGTAMGYLVAGFVNCLSLALHMLGTSRSFPIFIVPVFLYGLALTVVYVRVYGAEEKAKEEMFP